jgi:rRNA maturation endonuclease Nob1
MTAAFVALGVGTLLAVAALAYVLYPIFFPQPARLASKGLSSSTSVTRGDDLAVAALREIEFDRATGKLSDSDYAQLKERYTREALAGMRNIAPPAAILVRPDDEVEAAIRAYRGQRPACPLHGPRPETDAAFCSECGRYLRGPCEQCGRQVDETGARFCSACGHRLAA